MAIDGFNALFLTVGFLVPGFVWAAVLSALVPARRTATEVRFLEFLTLSCINHGRVAGVGAMRNPGDRRTGASLRSSPGRPIAHQQTAIERRIAATDQRIDRLVYELHGLTDEELRIVEEATSRS